MGPVLPLALIVAAYLIGSIPFSFLVARLWSAEDIRLKGSGNVGATNVMRQSGRVAGLSALLLDAGKGVGAVVLAKSIAASPFWPWSTPTLPIGGPPPVAESPTFWIGLAALAAVIGHVFPVWLSFKGGKGVATATGALSLIEPGAVAIAAVIFLIVVVATRYISLGSMVAAAVVPLAMRFVTQASFWSLIFATVIAIVVILKHHQNIARLARGEERKFPG